MATYVGSIERIAHGVMLNSALMIEIMESEHSRGELMACCHKTDIQGVVQKLGLLGPCGELDWRRLTESADTARRVAVEEAAHDEKHKFNRLVAVAVGSRGSWLSVLDIACSKSFIDGFFSRHTWKWSKSLLNSVAKLSKYDGNMEACTSEEKTWAHTARVAEVAPGGRVEH